jgi:hypothetical protein
MVEGIPTPTSMSPSSSQLGNSGVLVPGDGRTDVTSVLDHSPPTPSVRPRKRSGRPRLGAASGTALVLLAATGLLLDHPGTAHAATAIGLGTADAFAVLAGAGITNTNTTVITGDIGTFPTTTVSGESDIVLTGAHQNDTVTAAAKTGLLAAYDNAAGQASSQAISADLANPAATLTPGVYTSASSMGLTGALTLDAGGNADAVFVFQAGTTLTTGPGSSVLLIGGAQACNVFWQVGSSATLDTDTVFAGNVLAEDSITLNARASVTGRVLASNGAVTMDNNVVARPGCTSPASTISTTSPAGPGAAGNGPTANQVRRIPVGSVDAGDGTTATGAE